MERFLRGVAFALLLAGVARSQAYDGLWRIQPAASYACRGGASRLVVDRVLITTVGNGGTVTLLPSHSAGVMQIVGRSPTALQAAVVPGGFCQEVHTLSLTFVSPTQCSGTLIARYTELLPGVCGDCSTQTWAITGQRQLAASYASVGAGCAGSLGVPTLQALSLPVLGSTMQVRIDHLPLSACLLVHGFSDTSSRLGPLPAALAGYGMPGCLLHASLDAQAFLVGAQSTVVWSLAVPVSPGLIGTEWFQQALVPDPASNPRGAVMSDAARLTIGL